MNIINLEELCKEQRELLNFSELNQDMRQVLESMDNVQVEIVTALEENANGFDEIVYDNGLWTLSLRYIESTESGAMHWASMLGFIIFASMSDINQKYFKITNYDDSITDVYIKELRDMSLKFAQEFILPKEEFINSYNKAKTNENRLIILAREYKCTLEDVTSKVESLRKERLILGQPEIVCLCGSTRFKKDFLKVQQEETLKGNIVLSLGLFSQSDNIELNERELEILKDLHLRKIDMASKVIIINTGGYIGDSTKEEIAYAKKLFKKLEYIY